MRYDVTFRSQGLNCSAWLYVPENLAEGQRAPAIVMAHGFSCVKEQRLDRFAEVFVRDGFVVLVFDYRYFGHSEGEPRGQLFPLEQIEDYRNAISWLSGHPQVDPERIGVWGTSFSGGLVFHLSAFDRRIKAAVAQVPSVLNCEDLRRMDPAKDDQFVQFLLADRMARYLTGEVKSLKVVAPPGESCVLSAPGSYEGYMALSENAPAWSNSVTIESLERFQEFDPAHYIHLVAPTPMLIIAAEHDSLIPAALVTKAYERAGEPKKMLMLPCGHFDLYLTEPWFSKASHAAVEWFKMYV